MRPYVSIDIETTGLALKSHVLQISAVLDDGGDLHELDKIDLKIKHAKLLNVEPEALIINANLIKEIYENRGETINESMAIYELNLFLGRVHKKILDYDILHNTGLKGKIQLAGKNVGSFDIPMLQEIGMDKRQLSHRTIDVGSLYVPDFGYNANLSQINKLTGRNEVSHDALVDAMDVVVAIRHKMR